MPVASLLRECGRREVGRLGAMAGQALPSVPERSDRLPGETGVPIEEHAVRPGGGDRYLVALGRPGLRRLLMPVRCCSRLCLGGEVGGFRGMADHALPAESASLHRVLPAEVEDQILQGPDNDGDVGTHDGSPREGIGS